MPRERDYKREGIKVLYLNGRGDWLIKQTCSSEEEAEQLLQELLAQLAINASK